MTTATETIEIDVQEEVGFWGGALFALRELRRSFPDDETLEPTLYDHEGIWRELRASPHHAEAFVDGGRT